MKLQLLVLFIVMGSYMDAQNLFTDDNGLIKEIKEEYLIDLVRESKLIYCDRDSIGHGEWVKKIEIEFFDTTYFFSAYITSSMFTKEEFMAGKYESECIEIDDGREGWEMCQENLEKLRYFKSVLDVIIRETPFVEYMGPYPNTD